jgi:hypothetical protein
MGVELESNIRRFVEEVERAGAGAVSSVVLYGSAATGQFVPGRSDLNFMIVAERIDMPLLNRLQKSAGSWPRRRIEPPLLVGREFLRRSLDSYPLEILGLLATGKLLKGEDPLVGLAPEPDDVRVQLEREAKSKELLLRRALIASGGDRRRLAGALAGAGPAIEAMLRGVLYINAGDWRGSLEQLANAAEARGLCNSATIGDIRAIRAGAKKNREEIFSVFERTLDLIACFARFADRTNG